MGAALTSQIAVGIRIADLQQRAAGPTTNREWETLTRRIHDRITGSLYSLMLHIEAYSVMAERDSNPLAGRLSWLVPHGRHLLFDTRQYLYHLLPVLRGEGGLGDVLRSLAGDFERFSGIDVQLSVSGTGAQLPLSGVIACYDIIQYRLADVFHGAKASEVRLELELNDEGVRLSMTDDGVVDDESATPSGEGMKQIRRLAREVGGDLLIYESPGPCTRIVMALATQGRQCP